MGRRSPGTLILVGIKLTVDLDGLTWGQLIEFVEAGRAAGHSDDQLVAQIIHTEDPETRTVGLEAVATRLDERVAVFDHTVRLQYAEALSRVLETDGDARAVLNKLPDLRDGLLQ
jgi:hypothetical protein